MSLSWWIWIVAGAVLMFAELLVPTGFFLFFFGAGAVVTGLLTVTGVVGAFVIQGLVFVAVSLLCVVLLRKPLLARFHIRNPTEPVDSLVGETAQALESIAPQGIGKVQLRGSSWSALNTGSSPIAADVRCKVERVEGLMLHVRA